MNVGFLRRFLAPSSIGRKDLSEPFSDEKHTYATDGHILVRVPRIPEITADGPESLTSELGKDRLAFFHDKIAEADWLEIPVHPSSRIYCEDCDGSGFVKDCPECAGEGGVEWETAFHVYTNECKTCEGEGTVPGQASDQVCPACFGEGRSYPFDKKTTIAGVCFATRLLARISDLPGVKIFPVKGADEYTFPPSLFKFSGGDGFIMPRKG